MTISYNLQFTKHSIDFVDLDEPEQPHHAVLALRMEEDSKVEEDRDRALIERARQRAFLDRPQRAVTTSTSSATPLPPIEWDFPGMSADNANLERVRQYARRVQAAGEKDEEGGSGTNMLSLPRHTDIWEVWCQVSSSQLCYCYPN